MSIQPFVHLPTKSATADLWSPRSWRPAWLQIRAALALHVEKVIDPWPADEAAVSSLTTTSMRQGLGLIVMAALLGGFIPFVVNWVQAAQLGTALPLALWARYAEQQSNVTALAPFAQAWTETARTVAGLAPNTAPWLAAGVSALGAWMNWPLQWLTVWLVYGLGVLTTLKAQGATTTLPHFYAATSYAFVPLVLLGLQPIPYVGILFGLAGLVWALLIYSEAVRTLAQLSTQRVVISLLAPLAVAALVSLIVVGTIALVFLPLFF